MTPPGGPDGARTPERIDGYAPIRDYAVIGNKRTAALVALDGAIDWLCLPSVDSPSVFGALLDRRGGGHMRLAPTVPFTAARRYRPDTNVLETTFTTAEGAVRVTDALSFPTAHSLLWNQVIRRVDGLAGRVPLAWSVEPRFDYGRHGGALRRTADVPVIAHGAHTLAVEAFEVGETQATRHGYHGRCELADGEVAVLALSAFHDEPLTFSTKEQILDRLEETDGRWRRRLERCTYDGPWAGAVRRSVLALDLMIEGATGAMVAAGSMGLPERIGGPRNYDYRYAWLRDGNLTLEAMQRVGLSDEVHTSLGWLLRTVRTTRPRLRPIYRLDGRPRLPEQELDLEGYRGSRPVVVGNGAQDQLQLGNFGDVFDMATSFVRGGNALPDGEARELAGIADYLCHVWERPDASIWELEDRMHYTQGKLASWLALERATELAERGQLPDRSLERWRAERDRIRRFVRERCWSEQAGAYARAAGRDDLDASVLLGSRGSFFEDELDRFAATIDAVRSRLGAGGPLLYRYSGMEEQEGAFVACSFWLAEALVRTGRVDEGGEVIDATVALASDVGLLSEEIDPATGDFLGNVPQALSHLALVNAADVFTDAQSDRR